MFYPLHETRRQRLMSRIMALPGLVAYYPMNETSGTVCRNYANATKGTFNGVITDATIGQAGKVGKSFNFNGSSSSVDITGAAAINISVFTYMAIIYHSASGGNYAIYGGTKGSGTRCPEFRVNTTDKLELLEQSVASIGASSGTVAEDTWAHVAVSYSGTGVYTFYINGVASGTGTNLRSLAFADHYIGRQLTAEWFAGNIQHFAIINKIATAGEILEIARIAGLA